MSLITFDLDGVLQRNPFRDGVFPVVWRELGPLAAGGEEEVRSRVWTEFVRRQAAGDWVAAYDWDSMVAKVGAELGYQGEPFDLGALVERFCTPDYIHSYPGAHEVLAALGRGGHTLKVITNGFSRYQEPVQRALGLRQYYGEMITPDRAGSAKPLVPIFAAAGAPPALHVGDTLLHDVYGANLAGFTACWLPPELPEGWEALTPWERAAHPDLPGVMAAKLEKERVWHPAPVVTAEQVRPDYIIANLFELPLVVEHWLRRE